MVWLLEETSRGCFREACHCLPQTNHPPWAPAPLQVIADSTPPPGGEQRPFYDFLESCLRHKYEMVILEAARAICNLREVTSRELAPAITVLQLFLSSSKPVLRFAAVRTLNKVAMSHPLAVTNCNIDMEGLITDQNRSIATLAITTLLKTGEGDRQQGRMHRGRTLLGAWGVARWARGLVVELGWAGHMHGHQHLIVLCEIGMPSRVGQGQT